MIEGQDLTWHKIAAGIDEIQFAGNNIAPVEVLGSKICVAKFQGQVFAFAYKCPHAGGLFSEAELDKSGHLICPVHQYRFDIKNGRNVSGEGYHLKRWPVEVRIDGIYIGMPVEGTSN